MKGETAKQTDDVVSALARELLGPARKENVDFDYVGRLNTKPEEIIKVMQENQKVVGKLVRK